MKDINHMTLSDWSKYVDIYEYTEDHFQIEKALMEMNLMALHMDSYNYILEANELSMDQLDEMMVESGQGDRSYITSQAFYEAAGGVVGAVKNLMTMLANAWKNFWRKVASFFKNGNTQVEQIQQKEQEITKSGRANEIAAKIKEKAQDAEVNAAMEVLMQKMNQVQGNAMTLMERFDRMAGGGGVKIRLGNSEVNTGISVINDALKEAGVNAVDDKYLAIQTAITSKEYEIECTSVIPDMEKMLKILTDIMGIKDMNATADEMAYNAFKASLAKDGGIGIEGRCSDAIAEIQTMMKRNKRCVVSVEDLEKKVDLANKMANLLTKLSAWLDGGRAVLGGTIVDNISNEVSKNDRQAAQTEEQKKNFSKRYKADKDIYRDRGVLGKVAPTRAAIKTGHYGSDEKHYLMLCNSIYKLVQVMQQAVNIAIKALNEHMALRSEAIKIYGDIIGAVDEFAVIGENKEGNNDATEANNAQPAPTSNPAPAAPAPAPAPAAV